MFDKWNEYIKSLQEQGKIKTPDKKPRSNDNEYKEKEKSRQLRDNSTQ